MSARLIHRCSFLRLCSFILLAWLGALLPPAASAHEMTMAEMEVREITPGEFMWMWAATNEKLPDSNVIRPVWPEQCVAEDSALHCGKEGLRGPLSIDGVGTTYSAALVKIFWLDGQSRVYTISKGTPRVYLLGAADDTRSITEIASTYTVLGIEHIFTGLDHILFVISLLCLVGFTRRLVWTISAFTLAHMLTLTVCALGWLTLRPPPVEATIALSIVLVAAEALHTRQTLARRLPAVVSFVFGLVHGLGFAGALKEIGLPRANIPAALLSFNLGVELAQLAVVALAFCLVRWLSRYPGLRHARNPLLYGIGILASYWSFARFAKIVLM